MKLLTNIHFKILIPALVIGISLTALANDPKRSNVDIPKKIKAKTESFHASEKIQEVIQKNTARFDRSSQLNVVLVKDKIKKNYKSVQYWADKYFRYDQENKYFKSDRE